MCSKVQAAALQLTATTSPKQNHPPPVPPPVPPRNSKPFQNRGAYFEQKEANLEIRYDALYGAESKDESQLIFKGCVFYVDGFTTPSAEELKVLVGRHGGVYSQFFSLSRCTHVIATMLPDFKVKRILNHKRKRKPAVTAQWVVDCISQMKLLPVEPYLLPQLREAFRLNPAFAPRISSDPNDNNEEEEDDEDDDEEEERNDGNKDDNEIIDNEEEEVEEEEEVMEEVENDIVDQVDDLEGTTKDIEKMKESSPAKFARRTTGNDPNYLQTFLKNSRLHLIGSFRPKIASVVFQEPTTNLNHSEAQGRSTGGKKSPLFAHVDIDCFFAQVALLSRPELRDKPVAVAHSGGPATGSSYLFDTAERQGEDSRRAFSSSSVSRGGEISSANYVARAFGVKAGTFIKSAVEKCPNLIVLPYDFDKIKSISEQVHTFFHKLTRGRVEVLSCDEAYLDISELDDPVGAIKDLRNDIFKQTGCTVSAGIGRNKLFARIATSKAKPDGLVVAPSDSASITEFLGPLPATELPLVGWEVSRTLMKALGRNPDDKSLPKPTVEEVRRLGIHELQRLLGAGRGSQIYNYSCGVDDREFSPGPKARQSVGCEISYGVRFDNDSQLDAFIRNQLAPEVARRLERANEEARPDNDKEDSTTPLRAGSVTLKVMIRVPGAPIPSKHIGHGHCTSHSRTEKFKTKPLFESKAIADACMRLYKKFQADPTQVRGLGIQLGDLKKSTAGTGSAMMKRFLESSSSVDPTSSKVVIDSRPTKKHKLGDTPKSAFASPVSLKRAVIPQRLGEFLGEEAEDLLLSRGAAGGGGKSSLDPEFLARLAFLPQDIRLEQIKEAQRLLQLNDKQKERFPKARVSSSHVFNPTPSPSSITNSAYMGPDFSNVHILSSWLSDSAHLQPSSLASDESILTAFAINLIRCNEREDTAIFLRRLHRQLADHSEVAMKSRSETRESSSKSALSSMIDTCFQRILKIVLNEYKKSTGSQLRWM
jgi:DNA repair protein REV1